MFGFGLLTCWIIYVILVGFFVIGTYYAKLWGNAVFTYLLKKTSLSVQQNLKPNNTSSSAKKTISRLTNLGLLKNQQKRQYYSGKPCLAIWDKSLSCFPTNEVPLTLNPPNPNNLKYAAHLNKIDTKCDLYKADFNLSSEHLENSSISEQQKSTILLRACDSSDEAFNDLKLGPSFA